MSNTPRLPADLHVHSSCSVDGKSTIDELCEAAIALGLGAVCLTDHWEFDPQDAGFGRFDYEAYTALVEGAKAKYAGRLVVFRGVEIDYQHRFEDEIRRALDGKRFDHLLGAVHYVEGRILSEALLAERRLEAVYASYLDEVAASARSGLFAAIAHFDYVSKHAGPNKVLLRDESLRRRLHECLYEIIKSGAALEINTRGLVRAPRNFYPSVELLRPYRELGGKRVTVGSDAHEASEIGLGIGAAYALVEALGFRAYTPGPTADLTP
ncbi:MAG: histidinol-phosphatase HisJ family protein [Verrucomicrobia bacterium]|nr:histidinol-phosphatase HisJ family protein [Verrucomicrobiota bacterium]